MKKGKKSDKERQLSAENHDLDVARFGYNMATLGAIIFRIGCYACEHRICIQFEHNDYIKDISDQLSLTEVPYHYSGYNTFGPANMVRCKNANKSCENIVLIQKSFELLRQTNIVE